MIELNMDSTSLGQSNCVKNYVLSAVGDTSKPTEGAYKSTPSASMIYGVAVHKFIDVMYKTGSYPTANKEAQASFMLPKSAPGKTQPYLADPTHLRTTCYNLWVSYIEQEANFNLLSIQQDCWWCKGKGKIHNVKDMVVSLDTKSESDMIEFDSGNMVCTHCNATGKKEGPATELTFKIPFWKDEILNVNLCGTVDRVGQYKGGCFAIRDWKTTSQWDTLAYFKQYELSRQLRMYTLACKLMARTEPDSILGRLGATNMGATIDGIFLKSSANDLVVKSSDVFQIKDEDLAAFERQLVDYCKKLSYHIKENYFPKEGIINGTCDGKWGLCKFWNVCKSNDAVGQLLLARDFKRVIYDPLNFNKE